MTINIPKEVEICVIGGGPAGAAISRRLAILGHDVCLLERSIFPRRHVGESLAPSILPLFDALGVRERIERASFLRINRAIIRWSKTTTHTKVDFGEPFFLVDRGHFDKLLLNAAAEAGIYILQPVLVLRPISEVGRGWRVPFKWDNQILHINARFVVDASGKRSLLGGWRIRHSALTLAFYAYWRDVGPVIQETRVEAGPNGWFWGAPLPDGTVNAAAFIDPERYACSRRSDLESFYRLLLSDSKLLAGCIEGKLVSKVFAADTSMYADERTIGKDWIKVGGASFSLDPLSSQGVQAAMRSGIQGATVVHTILQTPENTAAAIEFYRERQQETVKWNQSTTAQFYAQQERFRTEPFWKRRIPQTDIVTTERVWEGNLETLKMNQRVRLSEKVALIDTPVIKDDIITTQPAIVHPALDRSVAFLNGIDVTPLLDVIDGERTAKEILEVWSKHMSLHKGSEILRWMWNVGIIVGLS